MEKWDVVELLRYARHDTLNQIQLLKGYLALGRTEKVKEILDQWIRDAEKETSISNLNCPRLASLFLTYKWQGYTAELDYMVEGKGKFTPRQDELLSAWFEQFFELLERDTSNETVSVLKVKIMMEQKPVIQITGQGDTVHIEALRQFFAKREKLEITEQLFKDQYFFVELTV